MTDPLFWLVLSLLFVTVSLTIVLAVAIPALRELARAARSAEKLFDTLRREFPPTLEAIRLTGMEITDLTDDVSEGVQSAGNVVKQVDESLSNVRQQAQKVQSGTRSLLTGVKVAWRTFTRPSKPTASQRRVDRLPPPRPEREFELPHAADPYSLSEADYGAVPEEYQTGNRQAPTGLPTPPSAEPTNPRAQYRHDRLNGTPSPNLSTESVVTGEHASTTDHVKRVNTPTNSVKREPPPTSKKANPAEDLTKES